MKLKYIKSHCCKCTHIRKNTMRGVEVVVPFDWPKKLIPSGKSSPARVLYLENGSSKLFITGQWSSEAAWGCGLEIKYCCHLRHAFVWLQLWQTWSIWSTKIKPQSLWWSLKTNCISQSLFTILFGMLLWKSHTNFTANGKQWSKIACVTYLSECMKAWYFRATMVQRSQKIRKSLSIGIIQPKKASFSEKQIWSAIALWETALSAHGK